MSEAKPATVSRSVVFGGLILLTIGIIAGGILGASLTQKTEELEGKLMSLSAELEKVRGENAFLRVGLGTLETESGNLKRDLEKAGKENETLRNTLANLEREVGQLKGGLESLKKENTALASSLNPIRDSITKTRTDMAASVDEQRQRIDGNLEKLGVLAKGIETAKAERTTLSQKDSEIEKRIAEEGKKLAQLDDSVGSLAQKDTELQKRIEADVQQLGAHGGRLEQEAKKLSQLAAALESVKKGLADGSGEREASAKDRQALRGDLSEVTRELQSTEATIGKLIEALSMLGT